MMVVAAMNIQRGREEVELTSILIMVGTKAKQASATEDWMSSAFFLPIFSDRPAQKILPSTEPMDSTEMKVEAN